LFDKLSRVSPRRIVRRAATALGHLRSRVAEILQAPFPIRVLHDDVAEPGQQLHRIARAGSPRINIPGDHACLSFASALMPPFLIRNVPYLKVALADGVSS